jgi:hypothetical protein
VKRWRGRYFFLQLTKQPNPSITYLDGVFWFVKNKNDFMILF